MGESERPGTLLVLDFDGVICDSVDEGFASSWRAYWELYRHEERGAPPARAPLAFRALRPFVRSGEDFLMMQDLFARGVTVSSQAEFDAEWERAGAPSRTLAKDLFYQARTALRDRDPRAWLAMNSIYAHVGEALSRLPARVPLYVLSTKKAQFVALILETNGIAVRPDQILYSEGEPKLTTVEKLRVGTGCSEAILVEDQIDAIRVNPHPRIHVYLAAWGYVQERWLRDTGDVRVLSPDGFVRLLAGL